MTLFVTDEQQQGILVGRCQLSIDVNTCQKPLSVNGDEMMTMMTMRTILQFLGKREDTTGDDNDDDDNDDYDNDDNDDDDDDDENYDNDDNDDDDYDDDDDIDDDDNDDDENHFSVPGKERRYHG